MESNVFHERIRIEISDKRIEMEHFHQNLELCYVLQGRVEIEMGPEHIVLFEEGIYLINANKKHSIKLSEDAVVVKVYFSFDLLSDVLGSLDVRFICNSNLGNTEQYSLLRSKIKKLLAHYVNTNGKVADFGHISLCYELLDVLTVNFQVRASDLHQKVEDPAAVRISQINNYVRGNYKGELSLKDLADKLYLSEAYLSRFFKKTYGMSFLKYVTNIRLSHAYDELLYSDEAITKIAYNNGFSTVALFNKSFKQIYGQTPSEARKAIQKQGESELSFRMDEKLQQKVEELLQKDSSDYLGYNDNEDEVFVRCESKPYDDLPAIQSGYRNTINGGCAEDLLRAEVREHLATLADQLHFEYVRFWNLFTPSMLIFVDTEDGEYNFSKIDGIIDFILSHGLKPAIDLGAKPRRITKNISEPIVCEEDDYPEKYEKEVWGNLMDKLFAHFNDYYGPDEVSKWIVELWYDERADKIQGYDYFDIFNTTASAIRKVNRRIRIGGSGIRNDKGSEEITEFLTEWRKQKEQPDFISMICFPYVSGEIKMDVYSRRSTDNDFFYHAVKQIRDCMTQAGFPEKMPLYVSEWNATLSDRNIINDTCYKGAYIVKNLIQAMDLVEGVGYFISTDRLVEYTDSNEILFGGSGLITKDSIFKPSAFAFEFLNRLKPKIVNKGKGYIITVDENENYTILCHNQKKLNYNYYLTNEGDINKKEMWKYYEDLDSLKISFEIANVNAEKFKVRIYRVNDDHGSILNIWKGLDFDTSLTRNDLKFCRRICEPGLTISTATVDEGVLDFSTTLKPNEITIINLKKI